MIFENLKPRLDEAILEADKTQEKCEVKLIYNELNGKSCMNPAFGYLYSKSRDFRIRHDEYRFVIVIYPKKIIY